MCDGVADGGEDGDEEDEGADDEDDDDSKPLEQLAASKQQADDKEEEQQEAAAGKKGGKGKQPATKPKKKKRKKQQQAAKLTDEQKGQVGGGEAGISIISPTGGTDEVGPGVCCRVSCRTTVCLAGPRAWTCSASRSCSCPSTSTSTGQYVSHTLLQPTLTQRPALTPCRLAGSVCVRSLAVICNLPSVAQLTEEDASPRPTSTAKKQQQQQKHKKPPPPAPPLPLAPPSSPRDR